MSGLEQQPMSATNTKRTLFSVVAASLLLLMPIGAVDDPPVTARADPSIHAITAADAFLDLYQRPDGRVVRTDQGGDTVSEGQAYAMLLAVGIGDESRFRSAWAWTERHLQRDDGLLAWHWSDGRVVDRGSASDADLLTAWALGLAGTRFSDPSLIRMSKRMARSVIAYETVALHPGRMLVAGPWATTDKVVNPSYLVTTAMSQLWWITGDPAWRGIAASARGALTVGTAAVPHLPSDWATIDGRSSAAPDGAGARFGYDAARVLVQLATDCDPAGRAIAARAWPFFAGLGQDRIAAVYSLQGARLGSARHPVALVAAAAAAEASGDETAAARLLDSATVLDAAYPTYYGSAWIALTRIWLDTSLLGGCG